MANTSEIILGFNDVQVGRIEALRAQVGAADYGDLVGRALAVYEYLHSRKARYGRVIIGAEGDEEVDFEMDLR